jgi:hypothetical protein
MAKFPRAEADITALATSMLAGYAAHATDFRCALISPQRYSPKCFRCRSFSNAAPNCSTTSRTISGNSTIPGMAKTLPGSTAPPNSNEFTPPIYRFLPYPKSTLQNFSNMQPSQSARTGNRTGISLLEVLISISILAVGLLSIAALIPAGHYALLETTKADRSAACGRAAKGEILTRSMINPVDPNGSGFARLLWRTGGAFQPWNVRAESLDGAFAIDPMAYVDPIISGSAIALTAVSTFPYNAPGPHDVCRLVYNPSSTNFITNQVLLSKVNESIFAWQDDLVFHADKENADRRGEQVFYWDDEVLSDPLNGDEDPNEKADATAHPIQVAFGGDYSWMLTVQPSLVEIEETKRQIAAGMSQQDAMADYLKTYEVSAVVFYKRDLVPEASSGEVPAERLVDVDLDKISGSDLTLRSSDGADHLAIKPNDWIMLFAIDNSAGSYKTAKWFRVLAVDEEPTPDGGDWIRSVTLDGPDIVEALGNPNILTGTLDEIHAVLADGVIGVYTTTVRLD